MTNTDERAFPMINPNYDGNWNKDPIIKGLTKREYFAGLALQVILDRHWKTYLSPWYRIKMIFIKKSPSHIVARHFVDWDYAAKSAYEMADEMIKQSIK